MMTPAHRGQSQPLEDNFEDDHPSITASLSDFTPSEPQDSPAFDLPSQHSGFRSASIADMESEAETSDSAGPWSPPAWRKSGSGWFEQHDHHGLGPGASVSVDRSPTRSRESSPGGGEITLGADVPLPVSPEKHRTPSHSPAPCKEGRESSVESEVEDEVKALEVKPENCESCSLP